MARRPIAEEPTRAQLAEEYGIDVQESLKARKKYEQSITPIPDIEDERMYVGVCRRLSKKQGGVVVGSATMPLDGPNRIDGRLVAAGFNQIPPRKWVGEHMLGSFVAWWNKTQENPYQVGSKLNAEVPFALKVWRFIQDDTKQAKSLRVALSSIPSRHWKRLLSRRSEGGKLAWDIVEHGKEIGRAIRRFTSKELDLLAKIDNNALYVLGSHGPEAQHAAVEVLKKREDLPQTIRPRDLDLRLMSNVEKVTTASPRAKMAYAHRDEGYEGKRFWELSEKLVPQGTEQSAFLAPAYPKVPRNIAIQIARGKTPVQISGGVLDKKEAHEWLSSPTDEEGDFINPVIWLTRKLPDWPKPRSIALARWMLDVNKRGAWGQLTKERMLHGPLQQELRYKFIDRLDEIQDEDLVEGPRTNVERAFERAAERAQSPLIDRLMKDHRVLNKSGWPLYKKAMHELNTPALLVKEGQEMNHCVGSYVNSVERGQDVILALNVRGKRSTVELEKVPAGGRRPRIFQHYGAHNSPPAEINKVLLERWLEKVFPGKK